ncbi:hypothetical protein FIV42_08190 [Persicimonas caeni]|uniref:Uncharacterized protein n=1 Tax=Persicimonas caeni TaxID=2292766 RepID=A0A4Y6PQV5_PERCE|nr:hypothetical protein [Persicimonas caeni]QDG50708.1 hypothetical protein FIV42_08190 [Persicimonas caeni]QED31929.1 hypothetical protein FRD00_08185 [Persicimonas caeni]
MATHTRQAPHEARQHSPEDAVESESNAVPSTTENEETVEPKKRDRKLNFWHWFFFDGDSDAGWKRLTDRWMFFHMAIGGVFTFLVEAPIKEVAGSGVLPLVAILFGLAFAWVGNALALITDSSFKHAARNREGGVKEYAYTYQLAVLTSLCTVVLWGLIAVGVADHLSFAGQAVFKFVLFTIASLTIRECWQVIYGAHRSLIVADEIDQEIGD